MKRPIALGLAPNLEKIDAILALKLILFPSIYLKGDEESKLSQWFKNYFKVKYAYSFASARGALTSLLLSKDIGKGDEVILQAFTCVAVANSILATGAKPIYVDVTDDFVVDPNSLKRKINSKTKAIILQHTFGIPAFSNKLVEVLKSKKIFIIEDCAHTIGGTFKGQKLGSIGDASVFSFGRDKAFSCVSGGMAITNNTQTGEFIKKFWDKESYPSWFWTFQRLFHSISFFFLILPLYNLYIGKVVLYLLQRLHLLDKPVATDELNNYSIFLKKLPSQLSYLILLQLKRIDIFNRYRVETSEFYANELKDFGIKKYSNTPLLRCPLILKNPNLLKKNAKKLAIYLGDWYGNTIDPKNTDFNKIFYKKGSCPHSEYLAEHVVNLPTHPTFKKIDREKIISLIKRYGKS